MRLNVADSLPNKYLAQEKVMLPAHSNKRDAKPILRSGEKWPCLTLHVQCNLQPAHMFCGATAVADLRELLAQHKVEQDAALSAQRQTDHQPTAPSERHATAAGAKRSEAANMKPATAAAPPAAASSSQPPRLLHIKQGAAELKQLMAGAPLSAVFWVPEATDAQLAALEAAVPSLVPKDASPASVAIGVCVRSTAVANQRLAAALKIPPTTPVVQVCDQELFAYIHAAAYLPQQ